MLLNYGRFSVKRAAGLYSVSSQLKHNNRAIAGIRFYSDVLNEKSKEPASKKKKDSLMTKIKHEVKHYVNGTKLLGYEIKISTKLLIKFGQGYELTRRETNQLKRTISDVFRLIPFSAFVIIPFAELLLPIALKIFPNLLPSTYESGKDKNAKRDKLLETRRKTSNFLHETLEESNLLSYNSIENSEKKQTFLKFFKKLYSSPKSNQKDAKIEFSHDEILTVAKMFKNDTVLDNLSRPQLIAICKFMSLRPFGNDNLIRYQIRYKLKSIMQDDITIDYEGISSLSPEELHQACVSRGIKAFGVSQEQLTSTLKAWLELRLKERVPSVLMMLSSTFVYGGVAKIDPSKNISVTAPTEIKNEYDELLNLYYQGILQVLSSIPDPVYNVAKLDVVQSKPEKVEEAKEEVIKKASNASVVTEVSKTASDPISPISDVTSVSKKVAPTEIDTVQTAGEAEAESEEAETEHDDLELKLNVLKEQEDLIKKEAEEAKERKIREQITDDINLDETEPEDLKAKDTKEEPKKSEDTKELKETKTK